ncbi:hypothetical protein SAMN05216362_15914 [Piscibacillus halophilus]|uniref:Uncharacterized protein n=1 Tax=Piscibacillus halophilus TaxID=571933 RepID=A0A1H9MAD4_9BACI|nr:hypothetical protein SAMN05216362_15914 [Piscibacillus halophilus]
MQQMQTGMNNQQAQALMTQPPEIMSTKDHLYVNDMLTPLSAVDICR